MRAAVIAGPGRIRVQRSEPPEPRRGEVLVRLEGCGVCGSNVPVWEGRPWFAYPLPPGSPGHEGWGTVDAVGDDVTRVSTGQRVALLSTQAFAEFDVAPADAVVPLPASLDGIPFPGEPLACAFNVFRRSGIEAGHTVAIVGIGFLGAVLVALAVRAGARVFAVSRRPFALDIARAWGAADLFELHDAVPVARRIRDATDGLGCDRVIEAVGLQSTLDLASELTRERGRLIIAGYHQDGPRSVDMQSWNWRGIDVVNAHERDPAVYVEGMRQAVVAVAAGELDPRPLLTHRIALDRLDRAFTLMRERPDGFCKAWMTT